MTSKILEILLGIIGLSIVVMVHEGGHFLAARLTGIRVETFSVGFGKRLFGFRKKETDFRLSLIPLGGYCRFYGEESFKKALEENLDHIPGEPGDYYSSVPWKRIIVAISGPAANVLFSIIVFMLISWIGYNETYTEPRVVLASEWNIDGKTWPADKAGLMSGDLITAVDGKPVDRFEELRRSLVFRPGESLNLTVLRNGREKSLRITPELDKESGAAIIGVLSWVNPLINAVADNSPARAAGFQEGDLIISADGKPTPHTVAFFSALPESAPATMHMVVDRSGKQLELDLPLRPGESPGLSFRLLNGRSARLNGFQAFGKGVTETVETLVSTLKGLRMLFLGIKIQNAVSGPIRLISDTGAVVAAGFRSGIGPGFLWSFELMSLISVSLAFLNLLPIPVLDGGQILLFLVETAAGKPIKPRSVYRYQFVGTIIVFIIAVAATTGDVLHFNSR